MRMRTFQGLRPSHDSASKVVALPYDVVSTDEARALASDNPLSLLHVTRAEIDFPEGTDPYSDAIYARAAENLDHLVKEGHLIREEAPCLYVYQQEMGQHRQRGIVALSHIEDYAQDRIRKHEKTRVTKENDRTRLTAEINANTGPVFLTYRDVPDLTWLMDAAAAEAPLYDLVAPDGIRHTVWRVAAAEAILTAFAEVPLTYVADGHHRAASAARVGLERRNANPGHTGEEDYNWFLTVLFPDNQLKILPYNRIVHDLAGHTPGAVLDRIREVAPVESVTDPSPRETGEICFYLDGSWYRIQLNPTADADPVSRLDVSLLQDRILSPILGIDDPRTSDRIDFVGGIRGTDHLRERVDAGNGAIAFSLYPVSVEELMAIADANQIMAPKSTWFEPKLRSGFFIHTL